jgi:nitrile hydratase accessory protein
VSVDDELTGELAPPMANGEVLFEAPWQGRVFGMARALAEAGVYDWEEFRVRLIEEIAAWDRNPEGEYRYYDHFLRALERLLLDKGLIGDDGLGDRVAAFAARPHGHDH